MSPHPARVQPAGPSEMLNETTQEGVQNAVLLDNNPRLERGALQERLRAELARRPVARPAVRCSSSVMEDHTASWWASHHVKWWTSLRDAVKRTGALRVPAIRALLLWVKSLLLLQRTRSEVKRSVAMSEQAAAQLLSLQDRVIEAERGRADERAQACALQAELEGRLAKVEGQLASLNERTMEAISGLEDRLRSASVIADSRLRAAEAAFSRLQRLTGGADDVGQNEEPATVGKDPSNTRVELAEYQQQVPARMDALFLEMSYAFRGSREEIKRRVGRYLPEVLAAIGQGAQRPVLDVGCGRGEWLEVLRAGGVPATGVDTNSSCVALCIDLGLSVEQADGIATLEGMPDGSLSGVAAFHVVEHMPFSAVVRLLDEAHRCTTSGGILLIETPNPESLMVGGRTFFFDPTHHMPIPPDVLALVAKERGFTDVKVERLHPYPDGYRLSDDAGEAERVLNQLLYGPQDYCILARRP